MIWILLVFCVLLLGALFWIVGTFAWVFGNFAVATIQGVFRPKVSHMPVETLIGRMEFDRKWKMMWPWKDTQLNIDLKDVDGQPDPRAVAHINRYGAELEQLVETALRRIPEIQESYVLSGLCSAQDGDVCLVFDVEDEDDRDLTGTIFVDFAAGQITTWCFVH